ncbi:hypothetical protein C8A05DRAFT_41448 [Staphylotrichum tortipilum]|uniref:Bet v1-like protein n=1 Tax=Staphylotrichum tortipilum TaxID=2831512 RepID=A0AAN6RWK8_9PEZI|nr:hypothetical protein C8A05DRAFT_41448 [Staphylotrichum longicolle]
MAAPAKPIATTNEVIESAVIKAPLSFVWHFVKLLDFQKFWTAVNKADRIKGATADTDVIRWTFKDGSSVEVKQDEYSNLDNFITYSVINSEPELTYSGVVSTIRCWAITSGELEDSTFVRWTSKFASDADLGVIEDAKYKRREALKDLEVAAAKMFKEHGH